uniref:EGF-like domain-containing protein n=1 Tax=Biomphalaria glabrata TaxID=6526 RepID=A0A2C9JSU9_BIOGL
MLIVQYQDSCDYRDHLIGFTASFWTHECPPNMYDDNCSTPCSCVVNNTIRGCNSSTGYCSCKSGWTGSDCSVDVDECSQNYFPCPDYSRCHNLLGGFMCQCKPGLVMGSNKVCIYDKNSTNCTTRNCSHMCVNYTPVNKTSPEDQCYCPIGKELAGDQCIDCTNWKYGPDCERSTICVRNHTAKYNSYNGQCFCYPNWTDTYCQYDFNECYYGKYTCQPHALCSNTDGGYECYCDQQYGYIEVTNKTCEHIAIDSIMKRAMNQTAFGIQWREQNRITDVDFADDVALLGITTKRRRA